MIIHDRHWAILAETLTAITARLQEMSLAEISALQTAAKGPRINYQNVGDGVAVIEVAGVLMKSPDFFDALFGAISSVEVAAAVQAAAADSSIKTILLRIDSPGGTVSGTGALADAIFAARQGKQVVSYIADKGASAAYWVASQSQRIYSNATALVGSIGTYSVLIDQSGLADRLGVKVHVVRAGQFKGLGEPGTAITADQLAELQRTIDALQAQFTAAVARGRGWPTSRASALADGRVHVGSAAVQAGLIDGVDSFDSVLAKLKAGTMPAMRPAMPAARPMVTAVATLPAAITARPAPTGKQISHAVGVMVADEMTSTKCSRAEAFHRLAQRNPKLYREYLRATGGVAAQDL